MPRIKMLAPIPRRPDVSKQYFHDHYRHPHGTWARQVSYLRGYTQFHQFDVDLLGPTQSHFEACAQTWHDNEDTAMDVGNHPDYVRDMIPDEFNFVDMEKLRFSFCEEEVICAGPDPHVEQKPGDAAFRLDTRPMSVQLLQFVIKDGSTRWDNDDDKELGLRIGALRHVRCRPSRIVHPDGAFVIGIRELYWPTFWDLQQRVAADREAWDILINRPAESIAMVGTAERFM